MAVEGTECRDACVCGTNDLTKEEEDQSLEARILRRGEEGPLYFFE